MAKSTQIVHKIADNKVAVAVISVIVLLVAWYFLFKKKGGLFGGDGLQTSDTGEEFKESIRETVNDLMKTQKPSFSLGQYASMAESIYIALRFSAADDNKPEAARILQQMKNDLDVMMLIDAFGERQEFFFGLPNGGKKALPAFVTSNMSKSLLTKDWITVINENYKTKGINFRF